MTGLVTAAELARLLGVGRSFVYDHAAELGAVRLGAGPKARLRFDPDEAVARMRKKKAKPARPAPAPRPPAAVELLPIKGDG